MKTLYLDCHSGISGDMFLGALIDLGVKPSTLEWELQKIELPESFHLHVTREKRKEISGVRFEVHEGRIHGESCNHGHDHHHGEHGHSHEHEEAHEHCCGGHHHDDGEEHEHHCEHGHEEHHHEHKEEGHHCCCGHDHSHEDHDHEHHHAHEHDGGHEEHCCGGHHHHEDEHEEHRDYAEIAAMIEKSELSPFVKEKAASIFLRIAKAEAKIHGKKIEDIHFHEVGAIDSIVDIIGGCVALEALGTPRVLSSPLVDGKGWVYCAHGRYPIPAPATMEILHGIPISQEEVPFELITPTGAAFLAEFAESFKELKNFASEKIGYGLGKRELQDRPNVLRAVLGTVHGE